MGVSSSTLVTQKFPFPDLPNPEYLFNTTKYLREYNTDHLIRWKWKSKTGGFYSLTGVVKENEFSSIPWGTFGGFEFAISTNSDDLNEFLTQIISAARQAKVRALKIALPPEVYLTQHPQLKVALVNNGFEIIQSDVNQHIDVTGSYRESIAYNELKKLKKSEREGFIFKKLNRLHLAKSYELIYDNRIRKGFPMSMTFEALDNMFVKLPNLYHLFGVYHHDKLIATAVSIRISQSSIYNFYHGDDEEYRVFSPVVMLLDGIFNYCQQQGIEILDLGISSDKGVLNSGLFKFKENCGALSSIKEVGFKSIDPL